MTHKKETQKDKLSMAGGVDMRLRGALDMLWQRHSAQHTITCKKLSGPLEARWKLRRAAVFHNHIGPPFRVSTACQIETLLIPNYPK
ncbi:hypothetical protein Baya_3082 [Bagarius yarrelli]|uniref:Uncharacterized protein n=1 Tax=Bagarius yarrelli TaxID=175774 RepID=A0A556TUE0_BAGYA|nr:hypothetical protein Baya_3082 [Bagarius yarrelli]